VLVLPPAVVEVIPEDTWAHPLRLLPSSIHSLHLLHGNMLF
jgi:hypothetical protein